MNIDGLHNRANSKSVLEVHGNLDFVYCPICKKRYDLDITNESIYCSDCKDILEPNVVLYGDNIRYYFEAIDLIGTASNLLVIGTSFYTSTVNNFVDRAMMAGINVDIINDSAEVDVRKYLKGFKEK